VSKNVDVSQKQIARDLGVSQALVSMALNGRRAGMSRDNYQRIWDYAIQIGYRPKGMQINETAIRT
jgi:LacI family transcriptional regulator